MKYERIHVAKLSYIAAFVIGVISFASIWKAVVWFGLQRGGSRRDGGCGSTGTAFWLRNEIQLHNQKDK